MPQVCQTATLHDAFEREIDGYPSPDAYVPPQEQTIDELAYALESEREKNRELETRYAHFTGETARILGERHATTPYPGWSDIQTQQLQQHDMGRMVEEHNGVTARHQERAEQHQKQIDEQEALIEELNTKIKGKDLKNTLLKAELKESQAELEKSQEEASNAYMKAKHDFERNTRVEPSVLWENLKNMIAKLHVFSKRKDVYNEPKDTSLIRGGLRLVLNIMMLSSDHTLWNHVKTKPTEYKAVKNDLITIATNRTNCSSICEDIIRRMENTPVVSGAGSHNSAHISRTPIETIVAGDTNKRQRMNESIHMQKQDTMPGLISAFDGFPWSSQY